MCSVDLTWLSLKSVSLILWIGDGKSYFYETIGKISQTPGYLQPRINWIFSTNLQGYFTLSWAISKTYSGHFSSPKKQRVGQNRMVGEMLPLLSPYRHWKFLYQKPLPSWRLRISRERPQWLLLAGQRKTGQNTPLPPHPSSASGCPAEALPTFWGEPSLVHSH